MKKIITALLLLLITLVSIWPLFQPAMFRTHDYIHGARIAELVLAAKDGHLPVRWTKNFGFGYGMPLFEFYAPLPYYLGGVAYWLSTDLVFASKLLWIIPSILSCLGAYFLAKRLWGRSAGIVAAASFTLAPYRAVDLFVRGALGEVWGIMAFPWIFLAMLMIFQKAKHGWQLLFFSLLALFLSHNLMTLLFVPFIGIWLLVLIWQHRTELKIKKRKDLITHPVTQFLTAGMLAAGASTFYVLPALTENSFTQMKMRILDGYFHYSLHFLYIRQFFQENWKYEGSVWGPDDGISFFLGFPQLALMVLGGIVAIVILGNVLRKKFQHKKITFKNLNFIGWSMLLGSSVALSLFFSLYRSKAIWDLLPALQVAQFPWRFLSLAIFFVALYCGAVIAALPVKIVRWSLVIVIVISTWWFGSKYFQPNIWLNTPEEMYYADERRIITQMSGILPDYIPAQMPKDPVPRGEERYELVTGEMKDDQVLVDRTHEFALQAEWPVASTVELQIADYPGWQLYAGLDQLPHRTSETGLIEVDLPAGKYQLSAKLENTPIRRVADGVSVMSWLLWAFVSIQPRLAKRDKRNDS